MNPKLLGIATAKRTGERRLLTVEEYFTLDRASEARWEFFAVRIDPETGEPDRAELEEEGFTPGGSTVIAGDAVEVEPGIFRFLNGDEAHPPKHWFER